MFIRKVAKPADVAAVLGEMLDDELLMLTPRLDTHTAGVLAAALIGVLRSRAESVGPTDLIPAEEVNP